MERAAGSCRHACVRSQVGPFSTWEKSLPKLVFDARSSPPPLLGAPCSRASYDRQRSDASQGLPAAAPEVPRPPWRRDSVWPLRGAWRTAAAREPGVCAREPYGLGGALRCQVHGAAEALPFRRVPAVREGDGESDGQEVEEGGKVKGAYLGRAEPVDASARRTQPSHRQRARVPLPRTPPPIPCTQPCTHGCRRAHARTCKLQCTWGPVRSAVCVTVRL